MEYFEDDKPRSGGLCSDPECLVVGHGVKRAGSSAISESGRTFPRPEREPVASRAGSAFS
jgi:hypothetical protein